MVKLGSPYDLPTVSFWDYHCNVACVVPENVSSKLDNSQVWTLK